MKLKIRQKDFPQVEFQLFKTIFLHSFSLAIYFFDSDEVYYYCAIPWENGFTLVTA